MPKREVKIAFDEMFPPETFKRTGATIDKPMRAEAWNNFTDALCKERRITMRQYETWTHPWKD